MISGILTTIYRNGGFYEYNLLKPRDDFIEELFK